MKATRPDTFVDEIRMKVKCTPIRGIKEIRGPECTASPAPWFSYFLMRSLES